MPAPEPCSWDRPSRLPTLRVYFYTNLGGTLETEDARRRSIADYDRQQRERRQKQDEAGAAAISRQLGRAGAIPLGVSLNSAEYRLGQMERQGDQAGAELLAPSHSPTPRSGSLPRTTFPRRTERSSPRRSRIFVGAITRGLAGHVWPLTALLRLGRRLRESRRKAKTLSALFIGCVFALAPNIPVIHAQLAVQLSTSPGLIYAMAFGGGALAGWLIPAVTGLILICAVYVTAVVVELGVYAGIIFAALVAIKHFQ